MSGRREFPVGAEEAGTRLETFLRARLGLARPTALKAIRKGWIRVDGKRAKPGRRLAADEVVKVTNYGLPLPAIDAPPQPAAVPADWRRAARSSLRFHDAYLAVSAKPAGRVVHRGSGHPIGWVDALQAVLQTEACIPIGRLDRDTSGLLALALGRGAARALFAALRAGSLSRRYQALVAGRLETEAGEFTQPLAKRGAPGEEQMQVDPAGQPARTRYRVLRRGARATLVEVELDTGRTHQIRAHFAAAGHPLLGDPRQGDAQVRRLARSLKLPRLFLHAGRLELPHPVTEERLTCGEPLPEDLERALQRALR